MIGSNRTSAELGVVAVSIWVVAYAWYFLIGNGRVKPALAKLFGRLKPKGAGQKPPQAKPRRP